MDEKRIRAQFPALAERPPHGPPVYLDSACMSLVPRPVLDAMEEYYRDFPGCAGRSLHRFAGEVTQRFEAAREGFAQFLGAEGPESIVFVRNATEAINLVGQGLPWEKGDRVLISDQEHNSNLVLWQRLAQERGIGIDVLDLPEAGGFDGEAYQRLLDSGRVRLVSLFHTSNLDGRSLPIPEIVERAHRHGARVLVDACQSAPHRRIRLKELGVDFLALSAHKMLGPTGTGVLAARYDALESLRPLVVGGDTVEWTTLTEHRLRPPPHRFEAGLQNYAGVLGAHAGLKFLEEVGFDEIGAHDRALNALVTGELHDAGRVRVLGPADAGDRPSIFAFNVEGVAPNDAALFLDEGYRLLLRSGMHCVHSWYHRRGLTGNVRASFYLYNTAEEARTLVRGIRDLEETFRPSDRTAPAAAA
jgi:cysteine desulfurase/selenocysteine lyase